MNKKLIAAAVAGAFVLPGIAAAQVTLSGVIGVNLANIKIADPLAARAALNKSATFVNDNVSVIRFRMTESLGGGLEAFGQYEFRPLLDQNAPVAGSMNVGSTTGITYVGLRSKSWGSVRAGSDVTFGQSGQGISPGASAHFSSSGIQAYVMLGGTSFNLNSGRTPSVIIYDTPDFGNGIKVTASYSSSEHGATTDSDLLSGARKGQSWALMPEYRSGAIKVGYAYGDLKTEGVAVATATTPANFKSNKLWGEYTFGNGLEMGLTWTKYKGTHGTTGVSLVDVKKILLPVKYTTGNHVFAYMLGNSADDRVQAGEQGAKTNMLAYNYLFSKRTNMGLAWVKMKNQSAGAFDLTNTSSNVYSADSASAGLGEDQTLIALSLNHSF